VLERSLLIYGAIADRRAKRRLTWVRRRLHWTRPIKLVRDVVYTRVSGKVSVDYRDYETTNASNVGDMAISEATRQHFKAQSGGYQNVNWDQLAQLDHAETDRAHRLLLVAGSGYFLFSPNGELPPRLWRDLDFFERTQLPVVLYGVGVNHLHHPEHGPQPLRPKERNQALLRRILDRASLISVRDVASQKLLADYTDKPVVLSGDPALFLQGRHAVNPLPRPASQRPRVGINFPLHGPLAQSQLSRNLPFYIDMLKQLQRDSGCEFHYFMHSEMERPIPWFLRSQGLRMHVVYGGPEALSRRYAEMDVHLGGMLHSCILATGAGTPCVSLAYDSKHQGFFDLFDMQDACHSATNLQPDAVLASLHQTLSERENLVARITRRKQELGAVIDDVLQQCAQLSIKH
jgi:polysaccharide pyruvyl transferase WcaK-like protein